MNDFENKEEVKKVVVKVLTCYMIFFAIVLGVIMNAASYRLEEEIVKNNVVKNETFSNTTNAESISNEKQRKNSKLITELLYSNKVKMLFGGELILLIGVIILNNRPYTRETNYSIENMIDPILAESLIDREIGMKEVIMTTVIDLSYRKNIEIISNESIQLISLNNLKEYEKEILKLMFNTSDLRQVVKKKILYFSDINKIFLKSNKKTNDFRSRLRSIRKKITDELNYYRLVSKPKSIISIVLYVASFLILAFYPFVLSKEINDAFFVVTVFFVISFVNYKITQQAEIFDLITDKKFKFLIIMLMIFVIWLFYLKNSFKYIMYSPSLIWIATFTFLIGIINMRINNKNFILTQERK